MVSARFQRSVQAGCGFATAILQWIMFFTLAAYIFKASAYQRTQVFSTWEKMDRYWIEAHFKTWSTHWLSYFL